MKHFLSVLYDQSLVNETTEAAHVKKPEKKVRSKPGFFRLLFNCLNCFININDCLLRKKMICLLVHCMAFIHIDLHSLANLLV